MEPEDVLEVEEESPPDEVEEITEGCECGSTEICSVCDDCAECCPHDTCGGCGHRAESLCNLCDDCDDCCECAYCENCGGRSRFESSCSWCRCLECCCECSYCSNCDGRADDFCGECDYCEDCCACSPCYVTHVERTSPTFWPSTAGEFRLNPSARYVALEVEIAGSYVEPSTHINEVVEDWLMDVSDDGSLPSSGCEIRTSPANGDRFVQQCADLGAALFDDGAYVTKACGLPTHADASDFTFYDMRRVFKLWAECEEGLFEIVPEERRRSKYCEPCRGVYSRLLDPQAHPKVSKRRIIEGYWGSLDTFVTAKKQKAHSTVNRYLALNFQSWLRHGTLELRLPNGSVDTDDFRGWGETWSGFLDAAYRMSEREIDELVASNLSSFEKLVTLYASPWLTEWMCARRDKYLYS